MTFVSLYPTTEARRRIGTWNPVTDIVESVGGYTIKLDVPGFAKDDLKVRIHEGVLTVSGERKSPEVIDNEYYSYNERPYGTFERSFRLPDHVDSETIKGSYEDGVLTLELTKKEEAKPHLITIE